MLPRRPPPTRLAAFAQSLPSRPAPPNLRPCAVCGVQLEQHARCAGGCGLLVGPGHLAADARGRCRFCARDNP